MPKKRPVPKLHSVRAELTVPELSKAGSSLRLDLFAQDQKIGERRSVVALCSGTAGTG